MLPSPCRILIVEDDPTISENLYTYLERSGFEPDAAYDGGSALGLLQSQPFDAVILDLGLPGRDGHQVLQTLRHEYHSRVPVLVLTARSQLDDKLAAFGLGADDYLVKPFALPEVRARLDALLRRSNNVWQDDSLVFENLAYDPRSERVTVAGRAVHLTRKSRSILKCLLLRKGSVVTRQVLEQAVWPDAPPTAELLRSQIHLLRKALQEAGFDGLETVHGQGWRLSRHTRCDDTPEAATNQGA